MFNFIKKIFNNESAQLSEEEILINDYKNLTNKIENYKHLINIADSETADALLDGISMYEKIRSSIFKKIRESSSINTPEYQFKSLFYNKEGLNLNLINGEHKIFKLKES